MNFKNVTVAAIMPTVNGTSRAGNNYTIKEVVFNIETDNAQYPQSISAKTMNASVIEVLDKAKVGDAFASVDIDFKAEEYNGRWRTENKLWRIAPVVQ